MSDHTLLKIIAIGTVVIAIAVASIADKIRSIAHHFEERGLKNLEREFDHEDQV